MKLSLLPLWLILISVAHGSAAHLKGTIKDEAGDPLPYATIYIKEIGTGTVSNSDGVYDINLKPGTYTVLYRYLGLESVERTVTIGSQPVILNVVLPSRTIMLRDVVVSAGEEDPAYTIMRKAIAKASYHAQQIEEYTARVYIKGKGRMIDAPFYLRKRLKKEGLDSTKLFVSETISKVRYKRPDTFEETVISVRTNGPEDQVPPMEFISGSFYDPKVAEVISPLSPRAFVYYKFEYLGTFKDQGYDVSKVRVIPRVKDEKTVSGYIQILEDYWSIHSLHFENVRMGLTMQVDQIYEPIRDKAWMPVTHQFYIEGEFWGFDFEYNYLASVSDIELTLNPDLPEQLTVIDEKLEEDTVREEVEETPDHKKPKDKDISSIEQKLKDGEQVTTKELRKAIETYEKAERKKVDEPYLLFRKDFSVDSTAYEKDSAYWAETRPIPLSREEVKGYEWLDSISAVEGNIITEDSEPGRDRKSFKPEHILIGGRYKIGKGTHFSLSPAGVQFNTVEGYNLEYDLGLSKLFDKKHGMQLSSTARYGFSSQDFYGKFGAQYHHGERMTKTSWSLAAGRYVYQFNDQNPIHPTVNSLYSLLLTENYMKIYEKSFASFDFSKKINSDLQLELGLELGERRPLSNATVHTWIDAEDKSYTSNMPASVATGAYNFSAHEALLFDLSVRYRPGIRFMARNDQFFELSNSAPTFNLHYSRGLGQIAGDATFNRVSFDATHKFPVGRNYLKSRIEGGGFIGEAPTYFMDFKHFMGNQTILNHDEHFGKFRLLDYYTFSTDKIFGQAHAEYIPSKLLLTHVEKIRFSGLKESIYVNYLGHDYIDNYVEVGIAFDNIFRLFRFEAVTSFQKGQYRDYGFMIGLASFLDFTEEGISINFE